MVKKKLRKLNRRKLKKNLRKLNKKNLKKKLKRFCYDLKLNSIQNINNRANILL